MAIKKLQNNYTTPEQSKRLLELGVPIDSADCCFYLNTNYSDKPHILYKKLSEKQADYDSPFSSIKATLYPCWSVGRLMEIFDICCEDRLVDDWKQFDEISPFNYIDYIIVRFEDNIMNFSKLEELV